MPRPAHGRGGPFDIAASYAARMEPFVSMLAVDWRDVVVAGEYELRDGVPVRVRDLTQPLRS